MTAIRIFALYLILAYAQLGQAEGFGYSEIRSIYMPYQGFQGVISSSWVQYPSLKDFSQDSSFMTMSGDVRLDSVGNIFKGALETEGLFTSGNLDRHYFAVPEIYMATAGDWAPADIYVGRKKFEWSQLDETWKTGFWQPRLAWDLLNPEIQGMMGVFVEWRWNAIFVRTAASPIWIPDQSTFVNFENGQIVPLTPWFSPPMTSINYNNQTIPINYSLAAPGTWDVVNHAWYAVTVGAGDVSRGFWIHGDHAYKPMGQFSLAASGFQYLPTNTFEVTLYPRVIYHQLTQFEAGYSGPVFYSWASALREVPMTDMSSPSSLPPNWTTEGMAPLTAGATGVGIVLSPRHHAHLDLSAIKIWNEEASDQGPLADVNGENIFPSRGLFQQMYSLGISSEIFHKLTRGLVTKHILKFEPQDNGYIYSAELELKTADSWRFALNTDILWSSLGAGDRPSGFVSRFQQNDRIYGSVSYVF